MFLTVRQRFIHSVDRQVAILRNHTWMHLRDIPIMPDRRGAYACIANIEFLGPFVGALDEVVIPGLHIHRLLRDSCPTSVVGGAWASLRHLSPASPGRISNMGRSVYQPPFARNACQARKLDLCQSFLMRAARSIPSSQDTFTGCGHVCSVLYCAHKAR